MAEYKFIQRNDNMGKLFPNENYSEYGGLFKLLKKEYGYILNEIEKENIIFENTFFDFFKELVFENKVVGFVLYEINTIANLVINELYVMPDFRHEEFLYDEIIETFKLGHILSIRSPSRNIVEKLIQYGFAEKITDSLVISAIGFDVENDEFINIDGESHYDNTSDDMITSSYIYDLNLRATLYFEDISTPETCSIYFSREVSYDIDQYGENQLRKTLTIEYFEDIKELFLKNQDQYIKLLFDLKSKLPEPDFGFKAVIGESDGLSDYMQNIVDEDIISYDEAILIKHQITDEYEKGEVTDDGILTRLTYLIENDEIDDEEAFNNFTKYDNICPSCYNPINLTDKSCSICGYNLFYEDEDDLTFDELKMIADLLEEANDESDMPYDFFDGMMNKNDWKNMNEFFNLFEDKPELSEKIFEILSSDEENYDEFEEIIMKEFEKDPNFFIKFMSFLETLENNELSPDEDETDLFEIIDQSTSSKYKLEDIHYGKDYPISFDLGIYRLLNSLKEYDNNIILTLMNTNLETGEDIVLDLIFNNNLIENNMTPEQFRTLADEHLTVKDLKEILRENKLKVSGNKQTLINRIIENDVDLNEFTTSSVKITPKGEEYLKDFSWIGFYDEFLNDYDFNDFYRYLDNHEGNIKENALSYLDEHIKIAGDDEEYLTNCKVTKDIIMEMGDEFLKNS